MRDEDAPLEGGFAMVRPKEQPLKLFARHTGHDHHLCELVAKRQLDTVAELAKGAEHVCYICGRAAAKGDNLCEPVKI
jgi:hypothetical protein